MCACVCVLRGGGGGGKGFWVGWDVAVGGWVGVGACVCLCMRGSVCVRAQAVLSVCEYLGLG